MFDNFFLSVCNSFFPLAEKELVSIDKCEHLILYSLFDFPSCFVQFRSTVTVELQCPREENSCLNRRNRHCKEQGKIDVVYFTGDLVTFFPEKL